MSSPILPITGPLGPAAPPSSAVAGDIAAFVSELDASQRALTVEAGRGGPPQEVLDQMAGADAIHQQLLQGGREPRFTLDGPGRSPTVALHDRETGASRPMTVAETAALAVGEPAE